MLTPRLFVFGLGYVGRWVAHEAREQRGWHVSGSCRSSEKADAFRRSGVEAFTFDLDDEYSGLEPAALDALAAATHVLATVSPVADLDRDPLLALHRNDILSAPQLRWAGYLSTTSVYGDHGGAWVDERAETRGSSSRLRAEQEWLGLRDHGKVASHVFRLAGIYGPGRSALDTVRRARREPASDASATAAGIQTKLSRAGGPVDDSRPPPFVNRIHVADISAALLASADAPDAGKAEATYNLADDRPTPRAEVMAYAAQLLGLPPAASPLEGSGKRAQRRAMESKRVDNGRLRALLPQGLLHPTYREGLRSIHDSESDGHGF